LKLEIAVGWCYVVGCKNCEVKHCKNPVEYDVTFPECIVDFRYYDILNLKAFLESPINVLSESIYGKSAGKDNEKVIALINQYIEHRSEYKFYDDSVIFMAAYNLE
jgi:hypothetical protein